MFEVSLNTGPSGARRALLRELSGREEALFDEPEPLAASTLVERLLVQGSEGSFDARSLGVSERDRILADLYLRYYGDTVESIATCSECRKPFGVEFPLNALVEAALRPSEAPISVEGPDEHGVYRLDDGSRFRLPTIGDEKDVALLPRAEAARRLLERCVVEGDFERCAERVEAAMGAVAPVLATELRACCAHCGSQELVWFDVASFFAAALARERPLLTREVHCLARAYGWGRDEILALSRSERREYVALVLAEAEGARQGRA